MLKSPLLVFPELCSRAAHFLSPLNKKVVLPPTLGILLVLVLPLPHFVCPGEAEEVPAPARARAMHRWQPAAL